MIIRIIYILNFDDKNTKVTKIGNANEKLSICLPALCSPGIVPCFCCLDIIINKCYRTRSECHQNC
ncbi:hypothetical protein DCAR_0934204 [Daucus carota subsp. sativus]|uniref:Uncharacterized protein n=1 Tax=Daucus carota subsp. sativus TaxID=79200 RepID=A0AAF0XUT4_DAUCS|nr:hypothetical protein DCAR_0934204 [Daucus carota subsp. sativus]